MELKDVIHYYIGQTCTFKYHNGITYPSILDHSLIWAMNGNPDNYSEFKLHLREISRLTDEEKNKLKEFMTEPNVSNSERNIFVITQYHNPESFHYLLSIGIDLFGLIDNNHALNIK